MSPMGHGDPENQERCRRITACWNGTGSGRYARGQSLWWGLERPRRPPAGRRGRG